MMGVRVMSSFVASNKDIVYTGGRGCPPATTTHSVHAVVALVQGAAGDAFSARSKSEKHVQDHEHKKEPKRFIAIPFSLVAQPSPSASEREHRPTSNCSDAAATDASIIANISAAAL